MNLTRFLPFLSPSLHGHVVTHCSVLRSLSCPLHPYLITSHLFIPTYTPLPPGVLLAERGDVNWEERIFLEHANLASAGNPEALYMEHVRRLDTYGVKFFDVRVMCVTL
jgi:hypothetical protein